MWCRAAVQARVWMWQKFAFGWLFMIDNINLKQRYIYFCWVLRKECLTVFLFLFIKFLLILGIQILFLHLHSILSVLGSGKMITPFYRKISQNLGPREPVNHYSLWEMTPVLSFSFIQQEYFKNSYFMTNTVPWVYFFKTWFFTKKNLLCIKKSF